MCSYLTRGAKLSQSRLFTLHCTAGKSLLLLTKRYTECDITRLHILGWRPQHACPTALQLSWLLPAALRCAEVCAILLPNSGCDEVVRVVVLPTLRPWRPLLVAGDHEYAAVCICCCG